MTQILDTKTILAKLMATENLIVEQKKVHTASFDVVNRVLTIPTLDNNIPNHTYDLFVGHEVGHALYTTEENLLESRDYKIPMSVINIIEDSRIERKIKYKYPGLKNSFARAYKHLFEENFFDTKGKNLNQYNFIDRINLHCKVGASLNLKFSDAESDLLKEVESTETFQDVIDVSKKIVDFVKQQSEENKQKQNQVEDDVFGEKNSFDDEATDAERESYELSECVEDDIEQLDEYGDHNIDDYNDIVDEEDEFKSSTDESYHRNESKLFSADLRNYVYVNIPDISSSSVIVDYKDVIKQHKEFANSLKTVYIPNWINKNELFANNCLNYEKYNKVRVESNKVVSYLVKEFELRKNADQLKKASTAKTGELNMNRLYSHTFSEDIFKKITVLPGGKSHGLVIFIDWSGSMHNHMENTIKQLINIVLFCKKVNIPYEVYAFQSGHYGNLNSSNIKENDLAVSEFRLLNFLSSRMSAADFKYSICSLMWFCEAIKNNVQDCFSEWALNSTPLNSTAIVAMNIIPEFQKKYKLQVVNTIFLTDGESDQISSCYKKSAYDNSFVPSGFKYGYGSATIVYRDTKTKHQEMASPYEPIEQTQALIKLLKHRTKCNVIGFYLLSKREFSRAKLKYVQSEEEMKSANAFSKNKYCVATNAGFDEYYLMLSDKGEKEDEGFTVKENATAKSIASAFTKYTGNKMSNRVMLNRFIGLIV